MEELQRLRSALQTTKTYQLSYGRTGIFCCDLPEHRVVCYREPPPVCEDLRAEIRTALQQPLDFPPCEQLFVPHDHVAVALDRDTPGAPEVLAELWTLLQRRGVDAADVTVVQPAALHGSQPDPRGCLPRAVAAEMNWFVHDPTVAQATAYLASGNRGERIYLARSVVEADVALSVGEMRFDPLLGYAGTASVFYPGLSSVEAISRALGEGHQELGPDDERPLRQLVDEVSWLLGTQFSVQVFAGAGGGVARVLAGATEAVFRAGREWLLAHARVHLPERVPVVVVAVDIDAAGHGWKQLGAALQTARNLVTRGGRIIVLSEFDAELGEGMKLLRESVEPRDALAALRKSAPLDFTPALQWATAADWARVFLLSRLPPDVAESLHVSALETPAEAARLLAGDDPCVLIGGAQHAHGEVGGALPHAPGVSATDAGEAD